MKKLIVLIIILFVAISSLYAVSEVDSLKKALSQVTIEERIPILNTLATKYWYIDPDSSIFFASIALELAQTSKDKMHEAEAYHKLGGAYYFLSDYGNAMENYKKAKTVKIPSQNLKWDPRTKTLAKENIKDKGALGNMGLSEGTPSAYSKLFEVGKEKFILDTNPDASTYGILYMF